MLLNHQIFEPERKNNATSPTPPCIIIPGLFGLIANWRGLARKLAVDQTVVVVEQRNHGDSPRADSQSFNDMTADLENLIEHHGWSQVVLIGHSLGGKVAMLFSLLHPQRVARLAVLDIAPVAYTHSHAPFLEHLMQVDLTTLQSRAEAERALQDGIPDSGTRLFLLQSLSGKPGEYRWRLNLRVLHNYMDEMMDYPVAQVAGREYLGPCLMLSGENSDYLQSEHHEIVLEHFPQSHFVRIANAGHWLHAEQPALVLAALQDFLGDTELLMDTANKD